MGTERIYLYPGWLRIWHGINALLCIILIWTGLSLQYAGLNDFLIRFDLSVQIHNVCGILLTANYLIFYFGNRFSQNGRQYYLYRKGVINNMIKQGRYYLIGIFKKEPKPFEITTENKFNPLQRLVYFIVAYIFMFIVIITGWLYLFPEILPNQLFGVAGIFLNDLIHISAGFVISIFLIIHVYLCTIGNEKMKNFKSMVNGWHE